MIHQIVVMGEFGSTFLMLLSIVSGTVIKKRFFMQSNTFFFLQKFCTQTIEKKR